MKIYSTAQTRAWDAYTIENEPIASVNLMNRAAQVFTDWLVQIYPDNTRPVVVFCGTGNNGGDGVAVARLLHWLGFDAKVVVCDFAAKRSADFEAQIALLPQHDNISIEWFNIAKDMPAVSPNALVIDALFGSGLNGPLKGEWAQVVDYLNDLPNEVVSIDLPSGLLADVHTVGEAVVQADRTFSFERPKLAYFFPENAERVGGWAFESIGLHLDFERKMESSFHYLTKKETIALYRPRLKFSHKGTFGHALLIAGSFGKMGAAVLAAKSCLRSGVGLLTVHAPRCGNLVLQTSVPEAMSSPDHRARFWADVPDIQGYDSIGVGPGIGKAPETTEALQGLLQVCEKPIVLDADALNLLSENPGWWDLIPKNSILSPHPKEFERLFGKSENDFERNDLQRVKAQEHGVVIVLKGAHTAIACPDGECWFNSTGNPGMATGGTGDVLTGILTGLLAQGYSPKSAALLGVYLHGLAGDLAASTLSQEALTAGDLVDFLGRAWLEICGS
ncbi:MAG: NAD(P)H-hydrate dehydratase [Lewinellaceae bacterium]|nr:NAD(P)H-hydrate dehydratase [Lewinellaceae bacterium]